MERKPKRKVVKERDKKVLLKEVDCKCPFCLSEDVATFEFHHIDGNRSNSVIENIIVLCPTCHAKIDRGYIGKEDVISMKQQTKITKQKKSIPFVKSELEAEFPGGEQAWLTYIKNTVTYPGEALKGKIGGVVLASFVVNHDGVLEDVTSLTGPPILRSEVERVLKQSPRWNPARQNGHPVKAYRKQPVTFQMQESNLLEDLLSFVKRIT